VVCERGELAEQPLRGLSLFRSGLLGDVGAQRLDLADRDLVRCTSPLHDRCGDTTGGDRRKPGRSARRASARRGSLGRVGDLSSAPVAPVTASDHVRGPEGAPLIVVYGDYECPFCAVLELRLRDVPVRVAFRHFPVRAAHPRAFPAACAAEAAGRQGAFWGMHDSLFGDQARLEDPHLWARAERLGLDVARFDADRRDPAVAARIVADFRGGLRAGVPTTPTLFHDGRRHAGRPDEAVFARLANLAA
jgi:protein-disulfide isomerase